MCDFTKHGDIGDAMSVACGLDISEECRKRGVTSFDRLEWG
jgi:hypothetical protein